MSNNLSVVVLNCDSHLGKGNSIQHVLYSLVSQSANNFEIILVDNGASGTQDWRRIKKKMSEWTLKNKKSILCKVIRNRYQLGYGAARNKGAKVARGKTLVFLDDDTILLDKDALSKIAKLATTSDFGCGAHRFWTPPKLFQKNATALLVHMEKYNCKLPVSYLGRPLAEWRPGANEAILETSMISNFGFCDRRAFFAVGGYPDFKGYGFEDDYLMFKLATGGYSFEYLKQLRVLHVTHSIKNQPSSLSEYTLALSRDGYFGFHADLFMRLPNHKRHQAIESLKPIHWAPEIIAAYNIYKNYLPLDLYSRRKRSVRAWQQNNRFDISEYARLIYILSRVSSLDKFVKLSSSDFDNLAPFLKSVIVSGLFKLSRKGQVRFNKKLVKWLPSANISSFKPKQKFNQFPCDQASTHRRAKFLRERYPFVDHLSFAIIGDDDQVSSEFTNDLWAHPVVIEVDRSLANSLSKRNPRIRVFQEDVRNLSKISGPPEVHTFITDPPYTFHGALEFIIAGLTLLPRDSSTKEFYVILNQTMMGKCLNKLLNLLSRASINVHETIFNFSHYPLPFSYREASSAKKFLKSLGVKSYDSLTYSSSSTLFIFRTTEPKISILKKVVRSSKIYSHGCKY